MSNHLKMDTAQAIHALHQQGWSQRKIARELGIDRLRELIRRRAPVQGQFEFLDGHPVIRPLVSYSQFVQSALRKEQNR